MLFIKMYTPYRVVCRGDCVLQTVSDTYKAEDPSAGGDRFPFFF